MEGYLGFYILSYVHDEDIPSLACTTRDFRDKVHVTRNTKEVYEHSPRRRVRRCVNMLRAQSEELDGRGQVEMVQPEQYSNVEVADNTYKIGHQVRIMNEPYYIYDNRNMLGLSGTGVRCARE